MNLAWSRRVNSNSRDHKMTQVSILIIVTVPRNSCAKVRSRGITQGWLALPERSTAITE